MAPFIDKPFLSLLCGNKYKVPRKVKKYDINMRQLYDELNALKPRYMKVSNHMQVYEIFRSFFRKNYPQIAFGRDFQQIWIGMKESNFCAEYDFYDKQIKAYYVANVTAIDSEYQPTEIKFKRLRFDLVKILCHEMVHVFQHIRVKMTDRWEQDSVTIDGIPDYDRDEIEYLSEKIELEAFAHCAAVEHIFSNGSSATRLRYIRARSVARTAKAKGHNDFKAMRKMRKIDKRFEEFFKYEKKWLKLYSRSYK